MKNRVKQYIASNYHDMFTASGKAKSDSEDIVKKEYKNVGLPRTFYPIGWKSYLSVIGSFAKANLTIKAESILFIQYPSSWALKYINLAHRRGNKVIVLIHDLNILRNWDSKEEEEVLKAADVLIVHTPAMKNFLKAKGFGNKSVVLGCFDYLYGKQAKIPDFNDGIKKVAFTGNLKKSEFIDKVNFEKITLNLYGIGIEERTLANGVKYIGCFPPDKLAENMNEHFGLVWDGDSVDTCSGQLGEYLKLIAPHKFSMYLSAGLPVIVWKESALAPLVKEYGIGMIVESLNEMEKKVSTITEDEYSTMVKNVERIKTKLSNGNFLIKALKEAESLI